MLHPNQFQVNEAWIAFTLNDTPIQTERDGAFDCICLMDAASCFILANEMVPLKEGEPSQLEAHRLLKTALAHKNQTPSKLFVPPGQFRKHLTPEAQRQGIEIVSVAESELLVFVGEAKEGFKRHIENRGHE